MSATLNQRNNAQDASFVIGSGLDDAQGRCGVFWVRELCKASGTTGRALARAEYRDAWGGGSGPAIQPGPIAIRCGVVDFQGNLDAHGGPDSVPETATWADGLYPLAASMGFNPVYPDSLKAEEIIRVVVPPGKQGEWDDAHLDKVFFELDVTDQVNWILSHTGAQKGIFSGQYAIVCLVVVNQGNTGKVLTYSSENCIQPIGGDAPWNQDGNTFHLLIESDNLVVTDAAESRPRIGLSGISLGTGVPNPFAAAASIDYTTGAGINGKLRIYSPDGRVVMERHVAGHGRMTWDARGRQAGIYLCRLSVGGKTAVRRLVVAR